MERGSNTRGGLAAGLVALGLLSCLAGTALGWAFAHPSRLFPFLGRATPAPPAVVPGDTAASGTAVAAAQGAPSGGRIELEAQIEEVYRRIGSGVVNITSRSMEYDFFLNPVPREGTGSGFFYDRDGHIVTNFHVIQGAEELQVTLPDGRNLPAEVVGVDPATDLAVIRVELPGDMGDVTVPPVGDSTRLRVGQFMVAIGNPFGLERTLTVGVVSSLGRVIESPNQSFIGEVIQTDAPINPGNSGGPLLNLAGEVVGVNSAILSPSGVSAGIGFAIPAGTMQRVVGALIRDGRYPHPSLGVDVFELTAQRAEILRQAGMEVPVERGLLIVQLHQGGAALQAGLRGGQQLVRLGNVVLPVGGDLITALDGQPVATERDMIVYLETRTVVGQAIQVTIIRDGEEQTVEVTLGELRT